MNLKSVCYFILKKLADRPRDWFILETEVAPELLADGVSEFVFSSAVKRLNDDGHITGEEKRLYTGRTTESNQGRRSEIIHEAAFRPVDKSTIPEPLWCSPLVHKTRRNNEYKVRARQITTEGFLAIESADVQDAAEADELIDAHRHNAGLPESKQAIDHKGIVRKPYASGTPKKISEKNNHTWDANAKRMATRYIAACKKHGKKLNRPDFITEELSFRPDDFPNARAASTINQSLKIHATNWKPRLDKALGKMTDVE